MRNPEEFDSNIINNYKHTVANYTDPNLNIQEGQSIVFDPIYKFCLREDLKNDKQFLPTKGEPLSTGYDVRAAFKDKGSITLKPFEKAQIPLGFRAFCPPGYWYRLAPRSSSFWKKHLNCLYGTIDETYENELVLAVQYLPPLNLDQKDSLSFEEHGYTYKKIDEIKWDSSFNQTLTINFGDAVGQIIPFKRQEMVVEEVSEDQYNNLCQQRNGQRGTGGFGSTDGQK